MYIHHKYTWHTSKYPTYALHALFTLKTTYLRIKTTYQGPTAAEEEEEQPIR